MIGNKIPNKITKASKILQQNNLKTVTNEHDQEIPKERYVSPEERQESIDELRVKIYNDEIKKLLKVSKNLETVTNEYDKEIPKIYIYIYIYISPEERQKIIDNLKSIIIV